MRLVRLLASLLLTITVVTSCGSDDKAETGATSAKTDDTTKATDGDEGDDAACPDGLGSVTVSAISGEDAAAIEDANASQYEGRVGIDETDLELTDAVAVPLAGGAALTFYLTDYELDHETVGSETLDATEDQLLITLFATVYQGSDTTAQPTPEPIEVGEVIPPSSGAADIGNGKRVFDVIIDNGEKMHNESLKPEGQIEILYLDDKQVCFSVDYTSYVFGTEGDMGAPVADTAVVAKHIKGTARAEIVDSMFG